MEYDVAIIGGGVSGTALLYTLSRYTNVRSIAIIEKCSDFGMVNSSSRMNSQTLHFGDIETNYSLEKAKKVKRFADMVMNYLEADRSANGDRGLFIKVPKMVLAVGKEESEKLKSRYEDFRHVFPGLRIIEKDEIARLEPRIVSGRDPDQELLALVTEDGYTVDFGKLSHSFVENSGKSAKEISVNLSTKVVKIVRKDNLFNIYTDKSTFCSRAVVVAAGGHSLLLAKSMGYGKEYIILSMAGSFYTGPKVLNGKVYTMQESKLPFAAIHGDPEVHNEAVTRFGPTAKPILLLERYNISTFPGYVKTLGFSLKTLFSLLKIASDKTIFRYLLRNFIYDMPSIGKKAFLREIQKIVPEISLREISFARKIGGTRPQIVNNLTRKLEMGEAKIVGEKIIFNVTPSPGASTCLGNAFEDTVRLMDFLDNNYTFEKELFEMELVKINDNTAERIPSGLVNSPVI
ncbi:MAG: FAD-dependent oxidoreductase [Bacteroidales bacterium]|nr:FAD-dependent oxidoreductase [Bacteroidales bacterium]